MGNPPLRNPLKVLIITTFTGIVVQIRKYNSSKIARKFPVFTNVHPFCHYLCKLFDSFLKRFRMLTAFHYGSVPDQKA